MDMTNSTSSPVEAPAYLDSLTDLINDCRSSDTSRRPFCIGATVLGALAIFFVPILLTIGVIGNGLTTYIMLSDRRLRKCRQNIYLALIAVSDSGNLLVWGLGWQILAKGLPWISGGTIGFFIVNVSDLACRLFRFTHNLVHALSANWFLLMTLDRVLTLHYPFRFRSLSGKFAVKALFGSFLASVIVALRMPIFSGWYLLDNRIACLPVPFYGQAVRVWISLWNSLWMLPPMLQLLATTFLNLLLLRKVLQIMRDRRSMTNTSAESASAMDEIGPSVTVMLLSLVYFLCSLPPCIAQCILLQLTVFSTGADPGFLRTILNLGDIGQILLLLNQSVNWAVLLCKNPQFRIIFIRLLTCGRRSVRSSSYSSSSYPNMSTAAGASPNQASNVQMSEMASVPIEL